MDKVKKMIFPKIVKKIKDFVTDESWNITEKSWLVIWATWVIALWVVAWLNEAHSTVNAINIPCTNTNTWPFNNTQVNCGIIEPWHFNWSANWHYNWVKADFWASQTPTWTCNPGYWHYNSTLGTLTCNPINWVVNWHYNITPSCSSSHSNHCNHASSWDSWDSCGWDSCG
jgi:hypothetical protein